MVKPKRHMTLAEEAEVYDRAFSDGWEYGFREASENIIDYVNQSVGYLTTKTLPSEMSS